MGTFLKYLPTALTLLPTIITAIDSLVDMIKAIEAKLKKQKLGINDTGRENKVIYESSDKFVDVLYLYGKKFLPKATEAELKDFKDKLLELSEKVQQVIESAQKLLV